MPKQAKILPFGRNASYYYDRFERHAENGNYLDALLDIRRAREMEPDNEEYILSTAEVLTEMGRYRESNVILLPLLTGTALYPDDLLYNIGCNFYGQNDFDHAYECFAPFENVYASSDLAPDAAEMLDIIDEDRALDAEFDLTNEEQAQIDRAQFLIDTMDYDGAVALLKTLAEQHPELHFVKNNLALAYYCLGDYQQAIFVANDVLKQYPQNCFALSNLALFHAANGVPNGENIFLNKLSRITPATVDEKMKVLLTFGELKAYDKAYALLPSLLNDEPYGTRALFLAGITAANVQKYTEAASYFERILKLDPLHPFAEYYKTRVEEAAAGKPLAPMIYSYQVPPEEIERRLEYLETIRKGSLKNFLSLWQARDPELVRTMLWGLYFPEPDLKSLCLVFFDVAEDRFADDLLKQYLLAEDEPDMFKQSVSNVLLSHNPHANLLAYVGGKLTGVALRSDAMPPKIRECYKQIIDRIALSSYADESPTRTNDSLEVLYAYLSAIKRSPAFRAIDLWAAALLYYAMRKKGDAPPLEALCEEFAVSPKKVEKNLALLDAALSKEN